MPRSNKTLVENEGGKEDVDDQLSEEVNLGDSLWVKLPKSSWWPAQVVDEKTVSTSIKPSSKRSSSDVLVRIYGSYEYMYVDVKKSRVEFKNILIANNFNHTDIMKKTLELDLPSLNSCRSRRQKSKAKGKVEMEGSDEGLSERDMSRKSQSEKARRKNGKQQKEKANNSNPETPDAEGQSKRQKLDGSHNDIEPSTPKTPNSASLRSQELGTRRMKVMQSLGLIAPSGSPFCNGLISPTRAVC